MREYSDLDDVNIDEKAKNWLKSSLGIELYPTPELDQYQTYFI